MGCCVNSGPPPQQGLEGDFLKNRKKQYQVSSEDKKLIKDALQASCATAVCSARELDELAVAMDMFEFRTDEIVCRSGDQGTHFFIVFDGTFVETTDPAGKDLPKDVRMLERGAAFGELALAQDCAQTCTVVCSKPGCLWGVHGETFRRVSGQLSKRQKDDNMCSLAHVNAFRAISEDQRDVLAGAMHTHTYSKGSVVLREGEDGNCIFIVKSGCLKVTIQGREIRRIGRGDYFGERAVIFGEPRSATVTSASDCTCLSVGGKALQESLETLSVQQALFENMIRIALCECRAFKKFDLAQIELLIGAVEMKSWAARTLIHGAAKGEPHDFATVRYGVILDGAISVLDPRPAGATGTFKPLTRGCVFGDEYISKPDRQFRHQVRCETDVKIAFLKSEALIRVFGSQDMEEVVRTNRKAAALKRVYFFQDISFNAMQQLVRAVEVLPPMNLSEEVVKEGDARDCLYLIAEGELKVSCGGFTRTLRKGEYFGERTLLFDEPRTARVIVAKDKTILWAIRKQACLPILSETMRQHLERRCLIQDTSTSWGQLVVGQVLGKGSFAVVRLATHETTHARYGLKCLPKSRIVKLNQVGNVQKERELLSESDHPFIMTMVRSFKDTKYVYFLTELLIGGDLYQIISEHGVLPRASAQFFFGCMMMGVEYLHHRSIVYRDLKPQNVMLSANGYPKLIDFGCATRLLDRKTYTVIGTPHYMAPEVILGKGYAQTVDVWSLGVCLFEFMCGSLPFADDTDDKVEIYKDILLGQLSFPSEVKDMAFRHVVQQLLIKSPSSRLGCSPRGFDEIRKSPFFDDFAWDKLLGMEIQAPFVPKEDFFPSKSQELEDVFNAEAENIELTADVWDKDF